MPSAGSLDEAEAQSITGCSLHTASFHSSSMAQEEGGWPEPPAGAPCRGSPPMTLGTYGQPARGLIPFSPGG